MLHNRFSYPVVNKEAAISPHSSVLGAFQGTPRMYLDRSETVSDEFQEKSRYQFRFIQCNDISNE